MLKQQADWVFFSLPFSSAICLEGCSERNGNCSIPGECVWVLIIGLWHVERAACCCAVKDTLEWVRAYQFDLIFVLLLNHQPLYHTQTCEVSYAVASIGESLNRLLCDVSACHPFIHEPAWIIPALTVRNPSWFYNRHKCQIWSVISFLCCWTLYPDCIPSSDCPTLNTGLWKGIYHHSLVGSMSSLMRNGLMCLNVIASTDVK